MKRDEIRKNRLKWIRFLMQPERKKAKGRLECIDDRNRRCCLGHACKVFIPEKVKTDEFSYVGYNGHSGYLPEEVVKLLGMANRSGYSYNRKPLLKLGNSRIMSLAILNDRTDYTPQEIGRYLLSVVEGGGNSPFKPLSDYEE